MDLHLDRVVRRKQLLELIGLSCATQWRMEKAGDFPARIKLGKGSVGWHLTEVEEWLRNRERVLGRTVAWERSRRSSDRLGGDSPPSPDRARSLPAQTDGRNV